MLYAFVYCKYISKASKFCGNRIYRLIVDDSKVSEKFLQTLTISPGVTIMNGKSYTCKYTNELCRFVTH